MCECVCVLHVCMFVCCMCVLHVCMFVCCMCGLCASGV